MPDRISEGYAEALNAIAEAGREIAAELRAGRDTAALAKEATVLHRRAVDHEQRMEKLEGEIAGALNDAERERDALREIAPQLHKIWPGPSTDRAEVMDVVDVLTEQAREATQAPAEQPHAPSGGNGTGGGLGERLRALAADLRHEASKTSPMAGRAVGLWDAAAAIDKALETNENEEGA